MPLFESAFYDVIDYFSTYIFLAYSITFYVYFSRFFFSYFSSLFFFVAFTCPLHDQTVTTVAPATSPCIPCTTAVDLALAERSTGEF